MQPSDLGPLFDPKTETASQAEAINAIRSAISKTAHEIFRNCPNAPERTIAIRRLQEAWLFARDVVQRGPSPHNFDTLTKRRQLVEQCGLKGVQRKELTTLLGLDEDIEPKAPHDSAVSLTDDSPLLSADEAKKQRAKRGRKNNSQAGKVT